MINTVEDMPTILTELACSGYLVLWNARYDEFDAKLMHQDAPSRLSGWWQSFVRRARLWGELTEQHRAAVGAMTFFGPTPTSAQGLMNVQDLGAEVRQAQEDFEAARAKLAKASVDIAQVSVFNHKLKNAVAKVYERNLAHPGFSKLSRGDFQVRSKIKGEADLLIAPRGIVRLQLALQDRIMQATVGGGESNLDSLEKFFGSDEGGMKVTTLSEAVNEAPATSSLTSGAFFTKKKPGVKDTFQIAFEPKPKPE